jgi:hypothetical protein
MPLIELVNLILYIKAIIYNKGAFYIAFITSLLALLALFISVREF